MLKSLGKSFKWAFSFILLSLFIQDINAQINCTDAPTASLRMVCEHTYKWDERARVSIFN